MKKISPTPITDDRLVSSSVPENDFGVWESSYTYSAGQTVIKGHRIWESVQSANLNHDPETSLAGWWLDIGPTNRWSMFDDVVGTSTSAEEVINVTLQPGRIDSLALMQLNAAMATITQRVGVEVVREITVSLINDDDMGDWFEYFFSPIEQKDSLVITDLAVYGESTIEINLTKNAGVVSCGICIVGLKDDLGGTLASPSVGINDYSRKSVDEFGRTSLVQRDFSKRGSFRMVVDNVDVDRVFRRLASSRATPAVWVGSQKYSPVLIYGFFKDFEIDIAYERFSYCTLNIEGMI